MGLGFQVSALGFTVVDEGSLPSAGLPSQEAFTPQTHNAQDFLYTYVYIYI